MQKKRYFELKKYILNKFIRIKGVISVNLVGSFGIILIVLTIEI